MKKRILSLLLTLAILLSLVPAMGITAWAGQAGATITVNAPAITDDCDVLSLEQKNYTAVLLDESDGEVTEVTSGQTLFVKVTADWEFWKKFGVDADSFVLRSGENFKNLTMTPVESDDSSVREFSFTVPDEMLGEWELHFKWSVNVYTIASDNNGRNYLNAVQDLDSRDTATYQAMANDQDGQLTQFVFTFDGGKTAPDTILTTSASEDYVCSPISENEAALSCFNIKLSSEKYTSSEDALLLELVEENLNPSSSGLTMDFAVSDTARHWKTYDLRNTTVGSYETVQDGTILTVKKLKYFTHNSNAVPIAVRLCGVCAVGSADGTKYGSVYDALYETATTKANAEANGTSTAIYLIADDTENVNIPARRSITLDLNGHVLKGDGTDSVITNFGTLTINDSDTTAQTHKVRYFTDETSPADGCYETFYDTAEGLTAGSYLTVTGGVITGGNGKNTSDWNCGGGIFNSGTLIFNGGNIIGNSAEYGGGIYNNGETSDEEKPAGNLAVFGGTITGNTSEFGGGVMISASYHNTCFIEGTQITMADGSTKNIEDVSAGEYVKSFNHETGAFENRKVTLAYEGESAAKYFTLHFSDGTDLSICGCHDLFEQSAMRYVTVSEENCDSFTGNYFYNAATGAWEKLVSVTYSADTAKYYSIYVAKTVNCIANGMLSVPDDIDMILNMYTFNADLTADQDALQADIEQYGIMEYEECRMIRSLEEYEAYNVKYLNILTGKGLTTLEKVKQDYMDWYADDDTAVSAKTSARNTMAADETMILLQGAPLNLAGDTPDGVTLGGTVIISGNTGGNLYLSTGRLVTIDGATPLSGKAEIGVTTETAPTKDTPVVITANGTKNDVQYFTSDAYNYEVKFVEGNTDDYESSDPLYVDHLALAEKDFVIKNITELEALAKDVNNGTFDFTDCTVRLADDFKNVDKDGKTAALTAPIGAFGNPFRGSFDGNGKTVKLNITGKEAYAGLFGFINGATIKNVGTSGHAEAHSVGGIAGYVINGSVINCYSTCDVVCTAEFGTKSVGAAGGIVGNLGSGSTVENCYATGTASETHELTTNSLGGVVGKNSGTVTSCYCLDLYESSVGTLVPASQLSGIAMQNAGEDWVALGEYGKVSVVDALNMGCTTDCYWGVMGKDSNPVFTTPYSVCLCGGKAYKNNVYDETEIAMPEGISYDSATKTYTLNNVTLARNLYTALYISDENAVTVKLKGSNQLGSLADTTKHVYTNDPYYTDTGICANGNITFTGDGSLTIYDMSQGISDYHDITFDKNFTGTVTINDCGTSRRPTCCLFSTTGTVSIKNGTFYLNNTKTNGIGASKISITGGTIYVKGGTAAIDATELTIADTMEVTGANETYTAGTTTSLTNKADTEYVLIKAKKVSVPCTYSAPLAAGDYVLILGGKEAGEFTVSGDCKNGFTLKNADGKFVSYAGGTLKADSSTAYTWKYDGGLYAETKVTTRSGFWWWSCKTTTTVTKTYLTFDGEAFGTSCCKVCAEVQVTDNEHTWAYLHDGDGKHEAYCTKCGHHEEPEEHEYDETTHLCVCGKLDPKQCYVSDVEVTEKSVTSYGGWWLFARKTTKYQYTIKPVAQNVCVSKVQYSGDNENWNTGTVFTSDVQPAEFYIRVTDTNGNVTNWVWENGDVTQIN